MNFPAISDKHDKKAYFNPQDIVDYRGKIDKSLEIGDAKSGIIIYQIHLLDHVLTNYETKPVKFTKNLYLVKDGDFQFLVKAYCVGSPAAVMALEELGACGIEQFIAIGSAGTLNSDLNIGDIVVCEKAIRDEGTSHHYVPAEKFAFPSKHLTAKIIDKFKASQIDFSLGPTWSLDALYRETCDEIEKYRNEGILTVDMEAAALFAVAGYRGLDVAAIFAISDSLCEERWDPNFHTEELRASLRKAFEISVEVLRENEG